MRDHFEYKLNDDRWEYHEDSKLVLGPLEIGRYELQVRAVNAHGIKDPVPARFIWNVNEAVEVQLDNPPVDTKAQTSQVAAKSSSATSPSALTVAQNKQVHPAQSAHWRRGITRCGCGRAKQPAPLVSSWVQEATPAFGRMDVSVAVEDTGWHELHAVATDPLGQSDPVGVTHRFFADFEPPEAHLELPSVQRENRNIRFVNCTDNYGCANELTVSIDGGAPTETTRNAFDTGELTEGPHQIRLWAHDQAGNKQTEPTVVLVEIDQTPPPKPTMVLVGGKETLEASMIIAEGTGSWQLEYQQAAATDCAPATFAPDPKWSGTLQKELVIERLRPLVCRSFATTELQTSSYALMDNVGNVARYTSETEGARVIGDALPLPVRPTITGRAPERLRSQCQFLCGKVLARGCAVCRQMLRQCVRPGACQEGAIAPPHDYASERLRSQHVSAIPSSGRRARRNQQSPLVLDVPGRLVDAQVFVRVSEPGAESWSVPTKAWVITKACETNTCGTTQYLDEKSDDPSDWTCRNCPEGSRCHGAVIWSDVKAQVGWRRIAGPAPQSFQPCVQLAVEGNVGSLSGTVEWVCDEAMPEWARWQILHGSSIVASGKVLASTRVRETLAPATYQLRVVLEGSSSEIDVAYGSNTSTFTSDPVLVKKQPLLRPTIMRLNASALNVSASVAVVDVQWSTDELFKPVNTKTRRNQVSPLVLNVPGRLVDAQVFVRVSEPGAESWSVPTKAWVTTETCLDTQYLEDTSPDPQSWQCQDCPEGAYCVGSVVWSDVVAKFGFWRVPGPAPQQFRACLLPSACLGAPNPDLYNRYYDGEREETKDLARFHWWNASGQPEACHEAWGFKQECEGGRNNKIPPAASAAPVAQASSAKGWPIAPCAPRRAPIVPCWPSAFSPFCSERPSLCTSPFERRGLWWR